MENKVTEAVKLKIKIDAMQKRLDKLISPANMKIQEFAEYKDRIK